eukprot:GHVS01061181.1.p1 GENE.GHVS01061181.1~~GHVS01061181.1.p1  ORF type:complete len:145 (+),score=27.84 GHVS01061181.1:194-628(+)
MTDMLSAELREPNEYGGRMLVSATATKLQTALPSGIRTAGRVVVPPQREHIVFVDVYEVSSRSKYSSAEPIVVELMLGPHRMQSAEAVGVAVHVCDVLVYIYVLVMYVLLLYICVCICVVRLCTRLQIGVAVIVIIVVVLIATT